MDFRESSPLHIEGKTLCYVHYISTYVSDNSTVSEDGESSQDVSGLMSLRFQNDNTTPEMYFNQQWSPICAHHFADNDFGAELFCTKLGIISFIV